MVFMAVQRAPGREDGRRLKYRCRSSVGTLIGIGALRADQGSGCEAADGTRLTVMLPPSRGSFFKSSRMMLNNFGIRREEEVESVLP
jgi:hypothetical protein